MLTVPTTPRPSDPVLPDPGGWTGVCLHLVTQPRTAGSGEEIRGRGSASSRPFGPIPSTARLR